MRTPAERGALRLLWLGPVPRRRSDGDTLDRLSILGTIGRTEDAARRRELFLALEPVWRSVNADDGSASPYRRLIALEVDSAATRSRLPRPRRAASGVPPDSLERWLLAILEAWRDGAPDTLVEPWDWYYLIGPPAGR